MDNAPNEHDDIISEGIHQQRVHQQTNHPTNWLHVTGTRLEAVCSTITKCRTYGQHAATHTDTSPGGNISSTYSTLGLKHTFARMSNLPPPSRCPGFPAAMMGQQQHQCGMVRLTRRITWLENEVHQALAVMDADTGKPLNYRQLMRSTKIQKGMEPFIGQRIWTIRKWLWQQKKEPHQHHRVHLPTWGTRRAKARRYTQAICVHSTTRNGWTQSNTIHYRRRQNQLTGRSHHPQGGNTSGQDALHHCHLHKKRALHDNVHLHLLPHDTFAPTEFHPNEIERHSGRSHQRI